MKQFGGIINSRQPLWPSMQYQWVRNSLKAVEWLRDNKIGLVSSVGMNSWEFSTTLASLYELPLKLIVSKNTNIEFYLSQFQLDPDSVEFIELNDDEFMHRRDQFILDSSDIIIPVSIRPNGFFSKSLAQNGIIKKTNNSFTTDYEKPLNKYHYKISQEEINPALVEFDNEYIIHWTKTSNHNWPDELFFDYYKSVMDNDDYSHSAFLTLQHILQRKNIIGSNKNIEKKYPVVSFSATPLTIMNKLFCWRARFKQMSFEPYGIGIERDIAIKTGITKVEYYDKKKKPNMSGCPWMYQSMGVKSDWMAENEYRYPDNFNLQNIPDNKLLIICRFKKEAELISKQFGLKAISYTNQ